MYTPFKVVLDQRGCHITMTIKINPSEYNATEAKDQSTGVKLGVRGEVSAHHSILYDHQLHGPGLQLSFLTLPLIALLCAIYWIYSNLGTRTPPIGPGKRCVTQPLENLCRQSVFHDSLVVTEHQTVDVLFDSLLAGHILRSALLHSITFCSQLEEAGNDPANI